MINRRQLLKASPAIALAAAAPLNLKWSRASAASLGKHLSDPAVQSKFTELVPHALAPEFVYRPVAKGAMAGIFNINVGQTVQLTGLRRRGRGPLLRTKVWGYGSDGEGVSWTGQDLRSP